ncbi:MAG: hypothetical protein LW720_15170 [Pirellula sp.]|jgi:hypothetical protein|nr:hypothetical protein [Pirellula sp.]
MKKRMAEDRFRPLEFHGRYGSVILDRDAWGLTLTVRTKRPGFYEICVTSQGYSIPVVREEMEFVGSDQERVIRLPSRMSDECIGRLYLRLRLASKH